MFGECSYCGDLGNLRKGLCNRHYQQSLKYGEPKDYTTHDSNKYIPDGITYKIECRDNKGVIVGYAIIDMEDVEKCRPYKWHKGVYVQAYDPSTKKKVNLHTLILGVMADHKDRNIWNNCKNNLRPCSYSENNCNVVGRSSAGYKGVSFYKNHGKFCARIKKNGVDYRLGFYDTAEEAALVYNDKAKELHGEFARLNFIRRKNNGNQD